MSGNKPATMAPASGGLSKSSSDKSTRVKPAVAKGERSATPARKENSSVNSAASSKKPAGDKKKDTSLAKKAGSAGSQASSKSASEYDALEYIAPLQDDKSSRPPSAIGRSLFGDADQDRRPGKKISMKLVATKAFGKDVVAGMTAADIAEAVMNLERVVLDDECIEEIDNLEPLGAIKQLHLQRNRLESICNLESLQHLQLLSLASNDIMDLRNLTCLCTLKALDVGYNLLDEVPAHELPESLRYLTTEGNPLRKMEVDGAWDQVYALPNLLQHDCRDIYDEEEEGEEEEEEEEEDGDCGDDEGGSTRGKQGGEQGEQGGGEQGWDDGTAHIAPAELMDLVAELGRKRLEAAAKVFEDSMALLRENRCRVVETQRELLARDREEQERVYDEAVKDLRDMQARQEAERDAHRASLMAQRAGGVAKGQRRELATQEEENEEEGREGREGLPPRAEGQGGDVGRTEAANEADGLGKTSIVLAEPGQVCAREGEGEGGEAMGEDEEEEREGGTSGKVLAEFVQGLRPE